MDPSYLPPFAADNPTTPKSFLCNYKSLLRLVSAIVRNDQQEAAGPCVNQTRIIRMKTVLARTGLSRSTIYRKMAEGTFPRRLKISTNGAGWHESDINRWTADPVGWRPEAEAGYGR